MDFLRQTRLSGNVTYKADLAWEYNDRHWFACSVVVDGWLTSSQG